jgi:hypothetical protein
MVCSQDFTEEEVIGGNTCTLGETLNSQDIFLKMPTGFRTIYPTILGKVSYFFDSV